MITKDTIDRIIDTARVEEVIADFVSLKKRGTNLIGLCPFHNEKTPSFYVSPAKGIYKCFGCGKAGGAVNFVMEHEHYSYPEALRYLAEKYNIEIEEEQRTEEQLIEQDEKESLYVLSSFAQKFYSRNLSDTEEGKAIGLSYFKERGFGDISIEKFQLGYALNSWNTFTDEALKNDFRKELLFKTGLAVQKEDSNKAEERFYDRFRGRVIFPIHNITGRVIGFGARILKTEPNSPKYLNSPESEIYIKSKSLYGIFFAKKAIIQHDECFLVEGYTDVISLHQSGIENVVASSGTSLTQDQIRLISRYSRNITVLYDGDPAGIKASLRGIDMILEEGCNVRVVLFPDGEDPDSFSQKVSMSELRDYIKTNSKDFIKFKTNLLLSEVGNDPIRKAGLIRDIVETISRIPDGITRSTYIRQCSDQMSISEQILVSEMNKIRREIYKKQVSEPEVTELLNETITPEQTLIDETSTDYQEREIVRLLLNYANHEIFIEHGDEDPVQQTVMDFIIPELQSDEIVPENAGYKKLFTIFVEHYHSRVPFSEQFFTHHTDDEIKNLSIELLTDEHELSNEWLSKGIFVKREEEVLRHAVLSSVYMLKIKKVIKLKQQNQDAIKNASASDKNLEELLQRQIALEKVKSELTKYLGIVVVK